ncbi:MAG: restriction endonuclease subunit S [Burkholderiaceae bacterium]|nr:restriction endonuclease subunit S [Burkholderiaceae bacterium]
MRSDWESVTLGELIRLEYGKPLAPESRDPNGLYPVYGANGERTRTNNFYCDRPSIIVGRKGSAGEVTLTEMKFWPLDVTYFVEFDRARHDRRFLYYMLTTLNLRGLANGVKPGINRDEVYALPVKVPALPEQRRIVAILDEAFEAIATARANTEKNLLSASEIFDQQHDAIFAYHAGGPPSIRLGDLATFRNGANFTKRSKGRSVQIIGVKDFQNHFWVPLDHLETVTLDGDLSPVDAISEGDILTVRSNGNPELIGRCMVVGSLAAPVAHSGFTIRIRIDRAKAAPTYVCHCLRSRAVRRKLIDAGKNKMSIKSLNQGMLAEIAVPLPPLATQYEAVARIEALGAMTHSLGEAAARKLAALDELKKSLLHQAFSGKL